MRISTILPAFALATLLTACAVEQEAPPAPEPPKLTGMETPGEVAVIAHQYCSALSRSECPTATIACNAYHQSFVKGCMTKIGVPPEYTFILMN